MADVKLTIDQANHLVSQLNSWAAQIMEGQMPSWNEILIEAHELEKKTEKAGLQQFAEDRNWKKFRPDSPDRH